MPKLPPTPPSLKVTLTPCDWTSVTGCDHGESGGQSGACAAGLIVARGCCERENGWRDSGFGKRCGRVTGTAGADVYCLRCRGQRVSGGGLPLLSVIAVGVPKIPPRRHR